VAFSVVVAISFPYQGGSESYLRAAAASAGEKVDVVVEDATMLEENITLAVVDVGEKISGVESSAIEKSNLLPTENDKTITGEVPPTTHTDIVDVLSKAEDGEHNTVVIVVVMSSVDNGANEKSSLLLTEDDEMAAEEVLPTEKIDNVDASSTAEEAEQSTETIGGLFGPIVSATDEQSPNNGQTNTATSTNSDHSSCQMKLQQADTNLDSVIDAYEYIKFLHNVGSISLSTTQFDELQNDYQVNFDHLATTRTERGGNDNVGIPIATMKELQKVCVYISKKGSSAVNEFDWDQISSSP